MKTKQQTNKVRIFRYRYHVVLENENGYHILPCG